MPESRSGKARKGSVVVCVFKGWLRLRWSYGGQRYTLSLGLPDNKSSRTIAELKARMIERDILAENFDSTLAKYKGEQRSDELTISQLFEGFIKHKQGELSEEVSLLKYWGLKGYLDQYFKGQPAKSLSEEKAFKFRDWLAKRIAPITLRERIALLRSCWRWAIKRKLISGENPWLEVRVKVPPKQRAKAFSVEEKQKILAGFAEDRYACHYVDFVAFLLATGCRPGEAAGLRWEHLSDDCSEIWIGESWSRGRQKATKTNQARGYELTQKLQEMLLNRKSKLVVRPSDRVFTSPKGFAIDDHNFRKTWVRILKVVNVPYRKPYTTRHTFVTHGIRKGVSPSAIAEITGHSEETLFRSYLGGVHGKSKLPELD